MNTLKIITLNVKLFSTAMKRGFDPFGSPPRMFYESPGFSDEWRTVRIAEMIVEGGYDVACLQELFDERQRAAMAQQFTAAGYNVIAKADDGDVFHEDSGLFIASKHPLHAKWQFNEYGEKAGSDAFADKGILGCLILLDKATYGCSNLRLFNTHLQASSDRADVRASQIRQARRFVARCLKQAPHDDTAAILCGDLNVIEDSSEYSRLLAGLRTARDLLRVKHPDRQLYLGYTWDAPSNTNMIAGASRAQERLDYVFAFDHVPPEDPNTLAPSLRSVDVVNADVQTFNTTANTRLSDHFAIDAEVRLA